MTVGYSFGDEHVNNIIFQALTVPNFRLVAFVDPGTSDIAKQLLALKDPRIWIIGGDGPTTGSKAHYFDTFVEAFMPVPPGNRIDTAVAKVLASLISKPENNSGTGGEDGV